MTESRPADIRAWQPMYWGDFLRDTGHLSAACTGAYLLLIGHYWVTGAALPDDDDQLRRIARMDKGEWRAARRILVAFFRVEAGRWTHGRVEKDLSEWGARKDKYTGRAKVAAEARWDKVRQGRAGDAGSNPSSMPQAVPPACDEHASGTASSMQRACNEHASSIHQAMLGTCPSSSSTESVVPLRSTTASVGSGGRWLEADGERVSWADDAQGVAQHFLDRREAHWPGHPDNLVRTPLSTLMAEAEQWCAVMPADVIRQVVERGMAGMRGNGDPNPPTLLKAFRKSLSSAAATHSAATRPIDPQPHGGDDVHQPARRPARNERADAHSRRSVIGAVAAEILESRGAATG